MGDRIPGMDGEAFFDGAGRGKAKNLRSGGKSAGQVIVVTTGIKPSQNIGRALASAM